MGWIWTLHATAAGLWMGCVLTEVAFERALQGAGQQDRLRLSALHRRVDLFIEVPAMGAVLLTGLALWTTSGSLSSTWFQVKLASVASAWIANAWCVVVVWRRHNAARRGDMAEFEALDRLQHRLGTVVLVGLVGGLVAAALRWD